MSDKWGDIFSAAKGQKKEPAPEANPQPAAKETPQNSPWADLEPEEREATVRLNVDIPLSLNDRLAAKARQLRKPKTELVRRLLDWALDDLSD